MGCAAIVCGAFVLAAASVRSLPAQDTTVTAGVRIGLTYDRNGKPGVVVTPVAGPQGDSVRTILSRDFDFSDRVNLIPLDSGPPPSGALNYALYARLSAVAVVQAAVTPSSASYGRVKSRVRWLAGTSMPRRCIRPRARRSTENNS